MFVISDGIQWGHDGISFTFPGKDLHFCFLAERSYDFFLAFFKFGQYRPSVRGFHGLHKNTLGFSLRNVYKRGVFIGFSLNKKLFLKVCDMFFNSFFSM